MSLLNRILAGIVLAGMGSAGMAGCAVGESNKSPQARVDTPTAGTIERPSALSYGTVTSAVKKNETTQTDLLQLFGGPNISTIDAEGVETWVYERTSSVTDSAGNSEQTNLEAFFGGGVAAGSAAAGGGVGAGKQTSNDQRRTVNSIKTLTIVVKFHSNKTVKDYSARASYF